MRVLELSPPFGPASNPRRSRRTNAPLGEAGNLLKMGAMKLRLGFLASHAGSNLPAIVGACRAGRLAAGLCVVICNNSAAQALQRARGAGIATRHLSSHTHPSEEALDRAILGTLREHKVNLI